jgi:pantoate--beta-alanine ligase
VEVISSSDRLWIRCEEARGAGAVVGLVPTMGALHPGHERLLQRARSECGFLVLSIFVNPLQFAAGEDLAAYPRPIERDRTVAGSHGCDLLFAPGEAEMYPGGPPEVTVDPGPLGERLEGAARPGHFRGVLTVVAKLFHMVGRSHAYFGEKDAQQLELVRRMVAGLHEPVNVVPVSTVREMDGLAWSSRNGYLGPEDRRAAPVLFEALSDAATRVRAGERDADVLRAEMARLVGAEPRARLEYVAVVDDRTWEDAKVIERPCRAVMAARVGPARLIDNLLLPWEDEGRGMHNTPEV